SEQLERLCEDDNVKLSKLLAALPRDATSVSSAQREDDSGAGAGTQRRIIKVALARGDEDDGPQQANQGALLVPSTPDQGWAIGGFRFRWAQVDVTSDTANVGSEPQFREESTVSSMLDSMNAITWDNAKHKARVQVVYQRENDQPPLQVVEQNFSPDEVRRHSQDAGGDVASMPPLQQWLHWAKLLLFRSAVIAHEKAVFFELEGFPLNGADAEGNTWFEVLGDANTVLRETDVIALSHDDLAWHKIFRPLFADSCEGARAKQNPNKRGGQPCSLEEKAIPYVQFQAADDNNDIPAHFQYIA
ncbi:unnamed protein product, partial [Amoebophrya sp. A120]